MEITKQFREVLLNRHEKFMREQNKILMESEIDYHYFNSNTTYFLQEVI